MRSNGLTASAYTPVADLDPRVAEALLAELKEQGVAAYTKPVESTSMSGFDRPEFVTGAQDRLYVDAAESERVKALISTDNPDAVVNSEDLTWAQIVAGVDQPLRGDVHPWPVTEDLDGPSDANDDSDVLLDESDTQPAEDPRSDLRQWLSHRDATAGDDVFTVGYPLGWGPTMAFGRLGNTNTFLQTIDTRLLQADLSVCSGNSGGAMYNAAGEVVGLMHAIIQTDKDPQEGHCSRLAFAVPAPLAQRIVQAALDGKPLEFSRLGLHMTTVKDGIRWRVAVRDVVEPAKSAGLMKTDILVAIDDMDIVDAAQLKNYLIERTNPGQQVRIKVRRGDVDLTFPVTLAGG